MFPGYLERNRVLREAVPGGLDKAPFRRVRP